MRLTDWWATPEWHAYERAYGDEPGTRARLLASATWQTRVVDLRPSEAELWRGVRKSYKSLIHATERRFADDWTPSPMLSIQIARDLHRREAGRVTRPMETWMCMERWLERGIGGMILAGTPEMQVGYGYFIRWGCWAYYASAACTDRDVNHAIVWAAMKGLKRTGCLFLETGWQGEAQDAKGRAIEFFRRGFGGVDVAFALELN